MKSKILVIVVLILVIGGGIYLMIRDNNKVKINNPSDIKETNESENIHGENVAIIYFSASGTTKVVAEYIQNATNGDLIQIIPEEEYTASDLNYNNNNSRANREQNDSLSRPKISNNIDVVSYDTIYLGYPIWWGDVPKIILTFLDTHDLSGKIVIPFCTSHSSGISGSLSTLKNYNKSIKWIDGKRFSSSNESEINDWLQSLNR